VSSSAEEVERLARRIHLLKLHRADFRVCQDWECRQNRERLAELAEANDDGAAA
jgi:hypothetical protein